MQFQNAVITPSGIAIFSAANTNKPIKFTRFLFTDSVTRLTGQETELPPNTWGNGSVDAVVGQDELQQFVIYASASNQSDYGYARGYGIYAEQEGVEYLVAVANCLGDPTYVSQMSGGYTRFHLALTIKYSVNSNVLTVEPNMAGLISRAEFEMWTERVVTTHSPSGAPYGEMQTIYGHKIFRDGVSVGALLNPSAMLIFGTVTVDGPIIPMDNGTPNNDNIGSSTYPWNEIYCHNLYADYMIPHGMMTIDGSIIGHLSEADDGQPIHITSTLYRNTAFEEYPGVGYLNFTPSFRSDSWNGTRVLTLLGLTTVQFYLNQNSRFREMPTRVRLTFVGESKSGQICSEEFIASIGSATSIDPSIPGQTFKIISFGDWRPQNRDFEAIISVNSIKYIYLDLEITQ